MLKCLHGKCLLKQSARAKLLTTQQDLHHHIPQMSL